MLDYIKQFIVAIPKSVVNKIFNFIIEDVTYPRYLQVKPVFIRFTKDKSSYLLNLIKRPKVVPTSEVVEATKAQLPEVLKTSPTLTLTPSQVCLAWVFVISFCVFCLAGWWLCQPEEKEENERTA